MSRGLRRRALFALPFALPVAAVAAKVAPGLASAPKPYAVGVVSPSAIRRVKNLKPLPFTLEKLYEPGGPSPYRMLKQAPMPWTRDADVDTMFETLFRSAWSPAKFSDADLAATLGIDGGGNDDKVAVAVVQPAQPVVA